MSRIFCIGETLIDFIPIQKETPLQHVTGFERVAGGAPMNAAIAAAKYGARAAMLTKVANDHFGDYLISVLEENGVDTSYIVRSEEGETGLAFVSVDKSGERSFHFYRKNAADLLLSADEIQSEWFHKGDLLHFCSIDLVESPMKQAHMKVINDFREVGGIVSFDPNVRLPLWPDETSCRHTITQFLPLADIVKVSLEELPFITNIDDEKEAIASLFNGNVKIVVLTKGGDGASIYLKSGETYEDKGFKVTVSDTTGAGDAFIGGFLAELALLDVSQKTLCERVRKHHRRLLEFANASGALTASVKGAIHGAPGRQHVLNLISTSADRD
ncbi:fructokinase [Bacillus glycinifermentans]|uniref:Carbohydrate kinase n=1 Tax=Bacillus glycinifermentans TaxID=1664069 RepID=A0A0J6ELN1_9BACI|nr:carbohydrate kinase [Bacillus glycinifermentans]ATH93777.1 carbohydrate kinase [Bacillus glycinifermentans]KMM59537.1 fructokinase [Bacillus glycinifermentans]KRT90046.1 fructokinase [Bacillus glycinifermentans]MEC0483728.1 carbohydrate kinase [Bacillus glycinifermentans]MEC0496223.1 carbohydrate kinase [Bacillus glycinifermentans]